MLQKIFDSLLTYDTSLFYVCKTSNFEVKPIFRYDTHDCESYWVINTLPQRSSHVIRVVG